MNTSINVLFLKQKIKFHNVQNIHLLPGTLLAQVCGACRVMSRPHLIAFFLCRPLRRLWRKRFHKTKPGILIANNWESRNAETPRLQCVDRPMRREIWMKGGGNSGLPDHRVKPGLYTVLLQSDPTRCIGNFKLLHRTFHPLIETETGPVKSCRGYSLPGGCCFFLDHPPSPSVANTQDGCPSINADFRPRSFRSRAQACVQSLR